MCVGSNIFISPCFTLQNRDKPKKSMKFGPNFKASFVKNLRVKFGQDFHVGFCLDSG